MLMNWTSPLDRILSELVTEPNGHSRTEALVPRADVLDDGETYRVIVEMPGVSKDRLALEVENGWLVVRGVRQVPDEKHVIANGRHADRPFERRFSLGGDIDRGQIRARLEDGLLHVTLPRKEADMPRKIEVQIG